MQHEMKRDGNIVKEKFVINESFWKSIKNHSLFILDNKEKLCLACNQKYGHAKIITAVHYRSRTEPEMRKMQQVLLPCCHPDDIRMRSHRLVRLDGNKSAASCQQA